MKVFACLACVFLSLQDGGAAGILIFTGVAGEDLTVRCPLAASAAGMFFCKERCAEGDPRIESSFERAQNARFSIRHDAGGSLQVTITQLMKSDEGQYRCGFGTAASSTLFRQMEIIVVDAVLDGSHDSTIRLHSTSGSSVSVRCSFAVSGKQKFFCKEQCREEELLVATSQSTERNGRFSIKYLDSSAFAHLYVSITQLTAADAGWYWCGLDQSALRFEVVVTEGAVRLSVAAPLVVAGVLSSGAALIICRRSRRCAEGVRRRGAARGTNKEAVLYENDSSVSKRADSIYMSLDPASRDLDQSYATLTPGDLVLD
ncbi:polymeric immunoglobulin receptor-like isoform X2 [Betta splendens]|uniref:polymeric immunoglobulin receptor-like isoform X2 n=1 Tax=Betta splendens TaxID=158456 RepID=UPI0010F6232B|nr:polymeric immunoglobulin receptor-like isoform X2 [Betta splendens]